MPGILSLMRDIFDDPRGMWLLSDTHSYTFTGLESSTSSQLHLYLPEVLAPIQYLVDAGLRPALSRQLSSTYIDFVDRYRKICQSHFDRATRGGGHLAEYYREVFVVLFRRTTQAWGSRLVSIVRVQLCQAGAHRAIVRSERVDIRVDDAAKAEIIARLGLKVTLTSDKVVTSPSAGVASRLEEVSEHAHTLSSDTVDSHPMVPHRYQSSGTPNLFSCSLPSTSTSSVLPSPERFTHIVYFPSTSSDVRSLVTRSPDMSTLINLFGRMTTTTLETDSRIPRCHGVFHIPGSNRMKPSSPILSPGVAADSAKPRLVSVEPIASPTKPTNTPRRRKIASLPTRRGKTSAYPSHSVFDSAGTTPHPIIPRPTERVKTRLVSTLPLLYTVEASCVATPKPSTPRQRKVHALYHKALPRSHIVPQNQALAPLATAGDTFSHTVSRSPPLVSDATLFDSPPTSSDELDTPPSTPPRSRVLLARTEGLAISSESDEILSHKEPLGNAKLPNSRQRCTHLDFTKGVWGRTEQPLTFTFGV
ncbi:hypothetical protein EDB84DRAFT_1453682 [Lactarius hengduanensis]|nr:hypothetical protein EDB84DRAFT_1453682 [Lactarius hengduanensis]